MQSTFPSLSSALSKHTFPSVGWAAGGFYDIWRAKSLGLLGGCRRTPPPHPNHV